MCTELLLKGKARGKFTVKLMKFKLQGSHLLGPITYTAPPKDFPRPWEGLSNALGMP